MSCEKACKNCVSWLPMGKRWNWDGKYDAGYCDHILGLRGRPYILAKIQYPFGPIQYGVSDPGLIGDDSYCKYFNPKPEAKNEAA